LIKENTSDTITVRDNWNAGQYSMYWLMKDTTWIKETGLDGYGDNNIGNVHLPYTTWNLQAP
jgi:hypothetical protein